MLKTRILVVDDEEMICSLIKDHLDEYVDGIDTAFNGQEALEKIKHTDYDCIVSDINMPKMNGIDLYLSVRSNYSGNLPFIFFSAHFNEQQQNQVLPQNHCQFIRKPKVETLVESVISILDQKNVVVFDRIK